MAYFLFITACFLVSSVIFVSDKNACFRRLLLPKTQVHRDVICAWSKVAYIFRHLRQQLGPLREVSVIAGINRNRFTC